MKDYWEESETKNKRINAKKIILSIVISILIVAIIVIVALYITNNEFRNWIDINIFRKEISQDSVATIELDETQTSNVYAFNKYIGILSKNKLYLYGSSGTEETNLDVQITNPLFDSANRFLVMGESNGQKVYLVEDKEVVWESEVEGNISKVYVNKNGYVSIIITGTSYKNVIITYNDDGKELFRIFLDKKSAMDVEISNDNKYIAIGEVDTSGSFVQSDVKIISIEKAQTDPNNSTVYIYPAESKEIITELKYQDGDKLVCMYNDSIHIVENNSDKKIIDVSDTKNTFADINLKNNAVRITENSSGLFANIDVEITNITNNKTTTYNIDGVATGLKTTENIMAVNLGAEVYFINTNGWLVKEYESSTEINDVILGQSIAGIIYSDRIEIIDL